MRVQPGRSFADRRRSGSEGPKNDSRNTIPACPGFSRSDLARQSADGIRRSDDGHVPGRGESDDHRAGHAADRGRAGGHAALQLDRRIRPARLHRQRADRRQAVRPVRAQAVLRGRHPPLHGLVAGGRSGQQLLDVHGRPRPGTLVALAVLHQRSVRPGGAGGDHPLHEAAARAEAPEHRFRRLRHPVGGAHLRAAGHGLGGHGGIVDVPLDARAVRVGSGFARPVLLRGDAGGGARVPPPALAERRLPDGQPGDPDDGDGDVRLQHPRPRWCGT